MGNQIITFEQVILLIKALVTNDKKREQRDRATAGCVNVLVGDE